MSANWKRQAQGAALVAGSRQLSNPFPQGLAPAAGERLNPWPSVLSDIVMSQFHWPFDKPPSPPQHAHTSTSSQGPWAARSIPFHHTSNGPGVLRGPAPGQGTATSAWAGRRGGVSHGGARSRCRTNLNSRTGGGPPWGIRQQVEREGDCADAVTSLFRLIPWFNSFPVVGPFDNKMR